MKITFYFRDRLRVTWITENKFGTLAERSDVSKQLIRNSNQFSYNKLTSACETSASAGRLMVLIGR